MATASVSSGARCAFECSLYQLALILMVCHKKLVFASVQSASSAAGESQPFLSAGRRYKRF